MHNLYGGRSCIGGLQSVAFCGEQTQFVNVALGKYGVPHFAFEQNIRCYSVETLTISRKGRYNFRLPPKLLLLEGHHNI